MVSSLFRLGSVVNIHSSGSLTLPSLIKSLFAFLLSLVALVFADFEKIHPTSLFDDRYFNDASTHPREQVSKTHGYPTHYSEFFHYLQPCYSNRRECGEGSLFSWCCLPSFDCIVTPLLVRLISHT